MCPVEARVWQSIFEWIGYGQLSTCVGVLDHLKAFGNLLKGKIKKNLCILFWLYVSWSIWLVRNEILFKGGHKGIIETVTLAKNLSWDGLEQVLMDL